MQALSLLSSFLRLQPPHLHLVLDTPLIDHLFNCLFIDTSAAVVDMALATLIMLIPHITTALVKYLPKLFLVYVRVLCWDLYNAENPESHPEFNSGDESPSNGSAFRGFHTDANWNQLHPSPDDVELAAPAADFLFTFLYGLFPLNFMGFVRKPRKYLVAIDYPNAAVLDLNQSVIRSRTEPHCRCHILHCNFFNTTPEDELVDSKWLKADPADLVTECLSLCIAANRPTANLDPPPLEISPPTVVANDHESNGASQAAKLKSKSWHETLSPMSTARTSKTNQQSDRVPEVPHITSIMTGFANGNSSQKRLANVERRKEATAQRDVADLLPRKLSMPPRLSESNVQNSSSVSSSRVSHIGDNHLARADGQLQNISTLQREVITLRNDLNFERYLKQQHITHIGQLQRKHINQATVESEAQNMFNTNRTLKAKLTKANELYLQLKKEVQTSRTQSKRYEETLNSRLKFYREEERLRVSVTNAVSQDIGNLKRENERLREAVGSADSREHQSQNDIIMYQREIEEMNAVRSELNGMKRRLADVELRELQHKQIRDSYDERGNRLETAKLELASRDSESGRLKKEYGLQIAALERQLKNASPPNGQKTNVQPGVQQVINTALAASTTKLEQLQQNYTKLLRKYSKVQFGSNGVHDSDGEKQAESMKLDGMDDGDLLEMDRAADDLAVLPPDTTAGFSRPNRAARPESMHSAVSAGRRSRHVTDSVLFDEEHTIPEDSLMSGEASLSTGSLD